MLTRKETEKKIADILKEQIIPLMEEYAPDSSYISLVYIGETISFNNEWWELDEAIRESQKIDYFENLKEED